MYHTYTKIYFAHSLQFMWGSLMLDPIIFSIIFLIKLGHASLD